MQFNPEFSILNSTQPVASFNHAAWGGIRSGVVGIDSINSTNTILLTRKLDVEILTIVFNLLSHRHSVLQRRVEERDGCPWLVTTAEPNYSFEVVKVAPSADIHSDQIERTISKIIWRAFDGHEEPSCRFFYIDAGEEFGYIGLVMHHFLCDALSVHILIDEAILIYNSWPRFDEVIKHLGTPLSYPDYLLQYSIWISTVPGRLCLQAASDNVPEGNMDLSNIVRDALPFEFRVFSIYTTSSIRNLSKLLRCTVFTLFLSIQNAYLFIKTNQKRMPLKVIHSGRDAPIIMKTVGNLADRMFVVTDLHDNLTFVELVQNTKDAVLRGRELAFARFDYLMFTLKEDGKSAAAPVFNFRQVRPSRTISEITKSPKIGHVASPKFPLHKRTIPSDLYYLIVTDDGTDISVDVRYSKGRMVGFIDDLEGMINYVFENIESNILDIKRMLESAGNCKGRTS